MIIENESLLKEFRLPGCCEWCGRYFQKRQPHHIRSRGASRLDLRVNLISLGAGFACQCHTDTHAGNIMRCDLLAVVAAREKVLQSDVTRLVDLLRRLIKPTAAVLRRELAGLPVSTRSLAVRELTEAGWELEAA